MPLLKRGSLPHINHAIQAGWYMFLVSDGSCDTHGINKGWHSVCLINHQTKKSLGVYLKVLIWNRRALVKQLLQIYWKRTTLTLPPKICCTPCFMGRMRLTGEDLFILRVLPWWSYLRVDYIISHDFLHIHYCLCYLSLF